MSDTERTLRFSESACIGELTITASDDSAWMMETVVAVGTVEVPPESHVELFVDEELGSVALGGLDHLRPDDLDSLFILNMDVSDAALAHVGRLTGLQKLDLSGSTLTDSGVARLSTLKDLYTLTVDSPHVTDRGVLYISHLTRLERLSLRNTGVSDAGLSHLARCVRLQNLDLSRTKIKGTTLNALAKLDALSVLGLGSTLVGDAELAGLLGWSTLRVLDLSNTSLTDASVGFLGGLRGLRKLDLSGTSVTTSGAAALHRQLPECDILHPKRVDTADINQVRNTSRRVQIAAGRPGDFVFRVPQAHVAAFLCCLTLGALEGLSDGSLSPRGVETLAGLGYPKVLRGHVPSSVLRVMRGTDELSSLAKLHKSSHFLAESVQRSISTLRGALSQLPPEQELRVFWVREPERGQSSGGEETPVRDPASGS